MNPDYRPDLSDQEPSTLPPMHISRFLQSVGADNGPAYRPNTFQTPVPAHPSRAVGNAPLPATPPAQEASEGGRVAEYLGRFHQHNIQSIDPMVLYEIKRIQTLCLNNDPEEISAPEELKNEWISAIEDQAPVIPIPWMNDEMAFWKDTTGQVACPPPVPDFIPWAFQFLKLRGNPIHPLILWVYGDIIQSWDPLRLAKASDLDGKLAVALSKKVGVDGWHKPISLDKAKRIKLAAIKYHRVISLLGPGVMFCKTISEKAEKIGFVDLEQVIIRCSDLGKHKETLNKYDHMALRLFKRVRQ